jgi:hypothetical protein
MFFLLYVPMTNQPLSANAIDELAEQFAEQLLKQAAAHATEGSEQPDTTELPTRLRQELRAQIASMMANMQQERLGAEEADSAEPAEDNSAESAAERDFLERCFKKSA